MSVFKSRRDVAKAKAELILARAQVGQAVTVLAHRGYDYPLSTMGVFAGLGVLISQIKLSPMHLPVLGGVFSGGLGGLLAHGARLLVEMGLAGGFSSDPKDDA